MKSSIRLKTQRKSEILNLSESEGSFDEDSGKVSTELEKFLIDNLYLQVPEEFNKVKLENLADADEFSDNSAYIQASLTIAKQEGLIKDFDTGSEYKDFDQDVLIELSKNALPITIDDKDGSLKFTLLDGQEVKINNIDILKNTSIESVLPDITFDVAQGGKVERAKEAAAAYKLIVLNSALKGILTPSIGKVILSFNFETFTSDYGFVALLNDVQTDLSDGPRALLMAANKKLSSAKSKKEQKVYNMLASHEDIALRNVNLEVASIVASSEAQIETSEKKSQKMAIREQLDELVKKAVEGSPVSKIFEIFSVNVENLDDATRISVAQAAREQSFIIKEKEQIFNNNSLVKEIERKIRRRIFREIVAELKMDLLTKYRNGEEVIVPPKR